MAASDQGDPHHAGGRTGTFVRDAAWTFVGVIVGVLALVVGIAQLTDDDKDPQPTRPAVEISGNVSGDCGAVGYGNTVDC